MNATTQHRAAPKQEFKLSVPAAGEPMPDINTTVATSTAAKPPTADQIDAKRAGIHAATHATEAAAALAEAAGLVEDDAAAIPPRENIESIDVTLIDGRTVVFGPPAGVSLTLRITMMLGDKATQSVSDIARVCICARSIDGKVMPPVTDVVSMAKVANTLGDLALDQLGFLMVKHWPPVRMGELAEVKKNLR